jgi:ATP synthase protein I
VTDPDRDRRMKQLEEKLGTVRKKERASGPRKDDPHSQAHLAWRMVTELVAGLLIGFGIGYGLDLLVGTMPLFLVLFTLLGLAAGITTMLRSAGELQRKYPAGKADDKSAHRAGDDEGNRDGD